MIRLRLLGLSLACGIALSTPAVADETSGMYPKDQWPLAATRRPLTLAASMVEISGDTLGINLSSETSGDPTFVAPDLFFGVSDKLTVGVTHDIGFCISGDACDPAYNDLGLKALFAIMQAGNLQAAVHGGLLIPSLDPLVAGLEIGMAGKIVGGPIALVFDPSLYVGMAGRDEASFRSFDGLYNTETFRLPIDLQYQLNFQTMVFLSSGVNGPLDGFGDVYRVPVGLGALFAVNNRIDFGVELEFLDLLGTLSSSDFRVLYARLAIRI
jgi:hypothetical protein